MNSQAALPFAGRTVISLEPGHFEVLKRTVATVFRLAHTTGWQALVDEGAPASLRFAPGNFGAFMGYDFHVTPGGPRLIEINTNAGGALVNGLHTAALCDPVRLACLCADLMPVETVEERLAAAVRDGVRGRARAGRPAAPLVIADEKPASNSSIPSSSCSARSSSAAASRRASATRASSHWRKTDASRSPTSRSISCICATPTSRSRRRARGAARRVPRGAVVVTPAPREYSLLADKRRLALLSSHEALASSA